MLGVEIVKILFWDIDGTLLQTGHAGAFAIKDAFTELKGDTIELSGFNAGGRTDNYICQQLLYRASGKMPSDQEVDTFCRHYETLLVKYLKKAHGTIIPPVKDVLEFFHQRDDYVQLLLTGNSRYGAFLKLSYYGLQDYFDFERSAFAENYYYRNDLAQNGLRIVKETWGANVEDIFVIGDTPFDIECGKVIGAKTIAVATGSRSVETLQAYDPWWCVPQLPDPMIMWEKLERIE